MEPEEDRGQEELLLFPTADCTNTFLPDDYSYNLCFANRKKTDTAKYFTS